jgi:hypothetical protein
MVANTREGQEALVAKSTTGGVFFLMGGQHLTADDVEMKERKMRAAMMEREKKKQLGDHPMRKEVLPILNCPEHELNNNVDRLKDRNLKELLKWKRFLVSKMGNMAAKKVLYKKIVGEGSGGKKDEASIMARWMDTNEVALDALKYAPIKMGDTMNGRFEAEKKKDIEQAYKKMTAKENNDLMQKVAKLEAEDINDNESASPSPTPV